VDRSRAEQPQCLPDRCAVDSNDHGRIAPADELADPERLAAVHRMDPRIGLVMTNLTGLAGEYRLQHQTQPPSLQGSQCLAAPRHQVVLARFRRLRRPRRQTGDSLPLGLAQRAIRLREQRRDALSVEVGAAHEDRE
jgi:hypothetical protein